jgi:lipoprotein-anchoring transpeptidase ErfK/SrfK
MLLSGCAGMPVMKQDITGEPPGSRPEKNTVRVVLTPTPTAQELVKASPSPTLRLHKTQTASPSLLPTITFTPIPTPLKVLTFSKLAPTTTMSFDELVGDNGVYEEPAAYPPSDTFRIVIDVRYQVVLVYKRGQSGEYDVPVRYMICSTGATDTPTPRGTFSSGDHKVRFGLFVNNGVYGQYWTEITHRIYFHSILYTRRDASYYTKTSYNALGRRVSHGCVRLLVPDARWIYYNIAPGTTIEIRRGDKEDVETAAIREQLVRPALPEVRPSLTPGGIPNTDNWSIDTYLNKYSRTVPAV